MATRIERRIEALESMRASDKSAAAMTARELLTIAVPEYTGAMPDDADLMVMLRRYFPDQFSATEGRGRGNA